MTAYAGSTKRSPPAATPTRHRAASYASRRRKTHAPRRRASPRTAPPTRSSAAASRPPMRRSDPHPLQPGRLHPRRPLPRPLVPLPPLRPLPRHHAADLLPEQNTLDARALRRRQRWASLQAVEQRRVVVERLVESLTERDAVVARLLFRHHHDLWGKRPHR
uniref:Uncharacterized protein n=1 Tax=Leersia perrieri TaxID=77586 RepID=A0A0D9XNY3_9ORYZ